MPLTSRRRGSPRLTAIRRRAGPEDSKTVGTIVQRREDTHVRPRLKAGVPQLGLGEGGLLFEPHGEAEVVRR